MSRRKIFSRIWYPKQDEVDQLKYAGHILFPVGLCFFVIPLALFLPGRFVTYLFLLLFLGFFMLRGVVLVRGAYTLPLDDEREIGLAPVSSRSRIVMKVVAVFFILISLLSLFFFTKYFFILFVTMAMASMIALAHAGFSTAAFLVKSAVLMLTSMAICLFQAGSAGAFVFLVGSIIAFPLALESFVKLSRINTAWSNHSLQSDGPNGSVGSSD